MEISNHSGEPVELAVYLYRADRMKLAMNSVRGGVSPLEVIPLQEILHKFHGSYPHRLPCFL